MGNISFADIVAGPLMVMVVGAVGAPTIATACVSVLNEQLGLGAPPNIPLPVAILSFPLTGSTMKVPFVTASQVVQTWLRQNVLGP